MIKYDLICENEHGFEGWFSNSDDYEVQKKKRLLACPSCGTACVKKAIMAPAISTSRGRSAVFQDIAEKIRTSISENCDDVGDKFADEARAIHYGEKPERGIYGSASRQEAVALVEEGVNVAPLPHAIAPRPKTKFN